MDYGLDDRTDESVNKQVTDDFDCFELLLGFLFLKNVTERVCVSARN